jgi:hypothetical protein
MMTLIDPEAFADIAQPADAPLFVSDNLGLVINAGQQGIEIQAWLIKRANHRDWHFLFLTYGRDGTSVWHFESRSDNGRQISG